jgi:hypothetical protein
VSRCVGFRGHVFRIHAEKRRPPERLHRHARGPQRTVQMVGLCRTKAMVSCIFKANWLNPHQRSIQMVPTRSPAPVRTISGICRLHLGMFSRLGGDKPNVVVMKVHSMIYDEEQSKICTYSKSYERAQIAKVLGEHGKKRTRKTKEPATKSATGRRRASAKEEKAPPRNRRASSPTRSVSRENDGKSSSSSSSRKPAQLSQKLELRRRVAEMQHALQSSNIN